MKRTIALLLSALMLLGTAAAYASSTMTLDEKLALQLQNGSGLTAEAEFAASDDLNLSILDEQANALLKALLPGSRLELKRVQGAGSGNRGKEDMTLTLKRGDTQLLEFKHTSDGVLESFASTLLGGKSYASARGDGLLFDLLLDRDNAWPGIERVIFAVNNADLEWTNRAETQLKVFTDKLSLWLQGYTRVSTERDSQNQLITINEISIPMADLKAQIKAMLTDLYADRTVINLLREVMTSSETSAYLEPSMLEAFKSAIDSLPLSGSVSISRRYDAAGRMLLDDMSLPMGGARGIESIRSRLQAGEGTEDDVLLEVTMLPKLEGHEEGSFYSLSYTGGPDADAAEGEVEIYKGRLLIRREPEENEDFTVQSTEADDETEYGFNLYLDRGIEKQDAQTRQYTREQEYSLVITPHSMEGAGEQSIILSLTMTSGADTRSATRFEGSLVWKDMTNETQIEAALSGGSAVPWVIPSVDASGSIRLDRMNQSQLAAQKAQMQADLLAALTRLGLSFLAPGI